MPQALPHVPSQTTSDDLAAVQGTLRGEPGAFDALVERYTPVLYTLSLRMLGSADEAEDAVQEIFLRVYRALPKYRITGRFYSWLYTIAINWLRSRLRSRSRRQSREHTMKPEVTDRIRDESTPDPAQLFIQKEGERLAQEAISRLRPSYRAVYVLRHVQGLSLAETAEVLRIPLGTVKTRLFRARNELATALEDLAEL